MSLRLQGTTRNGRPVTRECPVCGSDMTKDQVATHDTVWTCSNDDCAHREVR
jgi:ssDNA-binding Zn-finger/Zn-ribbon topoisomerase 1